MPDISKVTLPSGNTYDIKDKVARDAIASLSGGTRFIGVTTTPLTDGATTSTISIDGSSVTPDSGNIVAYGAAEFIWDGSKWIEFGDLSTLGALALKDTVSLSKGSGDQVLGEATTFTAADSAVSFSGGATDNFVKSYPGTTQKLATTTVPNVTNVGSASTWQFAMGTGADAETLIISGRNGAAPTLGTAKTVATGSLTSSGSGASVMTGLGTATTGSAVISVGTGTAAAQTITVGTNDKVKVAKYDDLSVSAS